MYCNCCLNTDHTPWAGKNDKIQASSENLCNIYKNIYNILY